MMEVQLVEFQNAWGYKMYTFQLETYIKAIILTEYRWENDIKMNFEEIRCAYID